MSPKKKLLDCRFFKGGQQRRETNSIINFFDGLFFTLSLQNCFRIVMRSYVFITSFLLSIHSRSTLPKEVFNRFVVIHQSSSLPVVVFHLWISSRLLCSLFGFTFSFSTTQVRKSRQSFNFYWQIEIIFRVSILSSFVTTAFAF